VKQVRVLLADDHALIREGLRALLERHPSVEVVGEAGNGREAVKLAEEKRPDVVLMDIAMPDLNGLDATRQIRRLVPTARVLVLTMYDDRDYIYELLRAGASGYLLKGAAAADLLAAIDVVAKGGMFLEPPVAGLVVEESLRGSRGTREPEPLPALTPREREILQLVTEGCGNQAIGERLGISPKTVEVHRAHISAKLDIHDVPGLVKYAIRKGIIKI
jgi:DNA-binding NarL/FixJ family response regulator